MLSCSRVLCEDYDTRQLPVVLRQDSGHHAAQQNTRALPVRAPIGSARSAVHLHLHTWSLPCWVHKKAIVVYTLLEEQLIMARQGRVRRCYPRELMCLSAFDVALLTACSSVDYAPLLLPLGVRRLWEASRNYWECRDVINRFYRLYA